MEDDGVVVVGVVDGVERRRGRVESREKMRKSRKTPRALVRRLAWRGLVPGGGGLGKRGKEPGLNSSAHVAHNTVL